MLPITYFSHSLHIRNIPILGVLQIQITSTVGPLTHEISYMPSWHVVAEETLVYH